MPEPIRLTIAHSPDPDDAFMWWPLGTPDSSPAIDTAPFEFVPVPEDIEALNRRAIERADLDITAISMHAYPHVREHYMLTSFGSSMGSAYGPKIVAREPRDTDWLATADPLIAIPGVRTSAYLALQLLLPGSPRVIAMPFDEIIPAINAQRADAGLVIHEGQLTFEQAGLHLVADLGAWWHDQTNLPLPLGANAVKRDLDDRFGAGTLARLATVLHNSLTHALANRERALAIAGAFTSNAGATDAQIDEFVSMYVNDLTLDMGDAGHTAVRELLDHGFARGLCPDPGPIDLLRPEG